jgi:alpha-N-acetylglucosaminidase
VSTWLDEYSRTRYGVESSAACQAWTLLERSVYNQNLIEPVRHALHRIPTSDAAASDDVHRKIYEVDDLWRAFRLLLDFARSTDSSISHELVSDLMSLAVELTNCNLDDLASRIAAAITKRDLSDFESNASAFLRVANGLDRLAAAQPGWELDTFVSAASAWSTDGADLATLRHNVLRILTLWDNDPSGPLTDYAARSWAGLVSGYYGPRWTTWIAEARTALQKQTRIDEIGYGTRVAEMAGKFVRSNARTWAPTSVDLITELEAVLELEPMVEGTGVARGQRRRGRSC